jgi:hypothetical protein
MLEPQDCPNSQDRRYGGLKYRYKDQKGRLIRLIDPITGTTKAFSTPLHAENWVIRNFTPGAVSCDTKPAAFRFRDSTGEHISVADLVTKFDDGVCIADLVDDHLPTVKWKWMALQRTTKVYQHVAMLRTQLDVRCNLLLLFNLDALRQNMVLYPADDEEIEQVRLCVELGAKSPFEVKKELKLQRSPELIFSALGHLYRKRKVFINFAACTYGQSTRISYVC